MGSQKRQRLRDINLMVYNLTRLWTRGPANLYIYIWVRLFIEALSSAIFVSCISLFGPARLRHVLLSVAFFS